MTYSEIEAVLFDWDLTLARVVGDVPESERLAALFQSQGLNYPPDEIEAAIERVKNGVSQSAVPRMNNPQTRRDIVNSYFRILKQLGYTSRNWKLGNRLYNAHSNLPTFLYDDALPVLRWLHQKGFALGIISNHAHSARPVMEKEVGEFIASEKIIISQEVGVHKPAPTIFRYAISRMSLPPAKCMFVGNNLAVDAVAAVEIGGFGCGLWLDREDIGADLTLPPRVFRITALEQVADFL